jgi:thioredoxin
MQIACPIVLENRVRTIVSATGQVTATSHCCRRTGRTRGDDLEIHDATELPVVVDFWAEWCGPCKMMAPGFADAARARPEVQFVKVDTEDAPNATAQYGIRGIPTMILFRNGNEKARVSGAMPPSQLLAWVDDQLR